MRLTSITILATLVFVITHIAVQTHPFGEYSIGFSDSYQQYLVFLRYFRENFLQNPRAFFYSWEMGIGDNLFGLFSYYVSSPLNLLLYLFPKENLEVGVFVLYIVKYVLIGVSASLFLEKYRINPVYNILLSLSYAFCGYATAYQLSIMWLDALYLLPFLFMGIDRILSKNRPFLFIATYAVMILSNFYIAYMTGLMSIVYFLYAYAMKKDFQWQTFVRKSGMFAVSALIGAGINLPMLVTTIHSLRNSKGTLDTLQNDNTFLNPFDIFSKFIIGSNGAMQLPEGLPNIYVPTFVGVAVIFLFFSKKISKMEKVITGTTLLSLWLITYLPIANYVLHGFNYPIWFNYRYTFVISFFFILFAARMLETMGDVILTKKNVAFLVLGVVSVIVFAITRQYEFITTFNVVSTVLALVTTATILSFLNKGVKGNKGLLLIVALLMVTMGEITQHTLFSNLNNYTFSRRYQFQDTKEVQDLLGELQPFMEDGSRLATTYLNTSNDPMKYGYEGITGFNSTHNSNSVRFFLHLGQITSDRGNMSMEYAGGTPFVDSLMNIRYIVSGKDTSLLTKEDIYKEEKSFHENFYAYSKPYLNLYRNIHETEDEVILYENDLSIGLGWVEKGMDTGSFDEPTAIYENANRVYENMFGKTIYEAVPFVEKLENLTFNEEEGTYYVNTIGEEAKITLTFDNPEQQVIYTNKQVNYFMENDTYRPLHFYEQPIMLVNGKEMQTNESKIPISTLIKGALPKGNTIEYVIPAESLVAMIQHVPMVYKADHEQLVNDMLPVQNSFKLEEKTNTTVKGSVFTEEDGHLILTIPYDSYWTAVVNGKEVTPESAYNALLAVPLDKGDNQVTIAYKVPHIGIFWLVGVLFLAVGIVIEKKNK